MTRCTATTVRGTQCKNLAATGTKPPRCSIPSHQLDPNAPRRKQAGAPKGNKNAEKHGAYSHATLGTGSQTALGTGSQTAPADTIGNIAHGIADLQRKRDRLSRHIDDNQDDLEPLEYARICDLLGRLDSRIARHYKQYRELTGEGANEMEEDMDAILEVLSAKFKVDLTGTS